MRSVSQSDVPLPSPHTQRHRDHNDCTVTLFFAMLALSSSPSSPAGKDTEAWRVDLGYIDSLPPADSTTFGDVFIDQYALASARVMLAGESCILAG